MAKSKFRVPHTLVLLAGMILLAWGLTYLLPHGNFERVVDEHHQDHERVVPGSYKEVSGEAEHYLNGWDVLKAVPKGFAGAGGIIFFVFIIGGAFGVFRATGAADALIGKLLQVFGSRPTWLIVIAMAAFATGSATIGMAEEYLPFVPMLLALCLALGYDSMTAIGILCVGYGVGYGAALVNPFTVFIAQGIAGVPGSGTGYRAVLLILFLAVGVHHVWSYARRVKADPQASYVADLSSELHQKTADYPRLNLRHILVLITITGAIGVLIWGLKMYEWYTTEMGGLFLALTILMALIGGLGLDKTAQEFCTGASELTTTALLIGFARTIQVVLDDGQVVDTIVYGVAQPLESLGPHLAAVGMLVVQSLANFFIPSGSGQAYVTMPLMAPLADLVGVSRQTAVLAYQFGDGFTNILVPTNAVLVGILAMARIPYERWLRFVVPFMIKIWILAAIALVVAVSIGYH